MANDRVLIQCNACRGWKMLLKYFPATGLQTRDNGITDWLNTHGTHCHSDKIGADLNSDTCFSLHTEASLLLDPTLQDYLPNSEKNHD